MLRSNARAYLAALSLGSLLGACEPESAPPHQEQDDAGQATLDGGKDPRIDAGPARVDARAADADVRADGGPAPSLYARDRALEVSLTLAEQDWARIRQEGRSLAAVYSGCSFFEPFAYTHVPAELTIDGKTLERVAVRKKGFIGSLSTSKPGLRIDLDEYVDDQSLGGEKVVTLNNSLTDTSLFRQCLAYDVFAAVGQPAPRCNFANVTVNGVALGTYIHVEAVKKPLLRRVFGDDEGDLYEGVMGDFRPDRTRFLEKKTNEDAPPSPELAALTAALEKPDAELLAALEPLLDLDDFLVYWATEALINHEDSYSGNQNNFFVYVHADTRKLHFIPWGTDGTFGEDSNAFVERPQSVYATARLARRLYAIPSIQERYRATLRKILDQHWDEAWLLRRLDEMAELVGAASNEDRTRQLRAFIEGRRAVLEAELAAPAEPWPFAERGELRCDPTRRMPIQGTFVAAWETSVLSPTIALENAVQLELKDSPLATLLTTTSAGPTPDGLLALTYVMFQLDGSLAVAQLRTTRQALSVGELPFHGFETFGVVLRGPSADELRIEGFFSDGSIRFDKVATRAGELVAGSFEGVFTSNRLWE
jgi:hypothetical protein